ncbi:MAG: hypothetical protein IJH47_04170 [Oscillospiraceae bacterium]|nr:hypothetical protein [Oscillospiraceae bacterium]
MELMELYRQNTLLPRIVKDFRHQAEELAQLNQAYAIMLTEQGLLSREDGQTIHRGIAAVLAEMTEADLDPIKMDLFFNFDSALKARIGADTAGRLHLGRSRNDTYHALFRMDMRRAIGEIFAELLETGQLLSEKARDYADAIIPYYTYGQPAQPGTWGHYLLDVYENLLRDMRRLRAAYANVNRSPMGAAACTGTLFPIDRRRLAELLGFDGVVEHSLDAVGSTDHFLETESSFAIVNATLNKTACDMMFLSSAECGVLSFDRSICSGSSIMPQKKNSTVIERLRSMTAEYPGYLISTFLSAGGVTMFPCKDNHEHLFMFWDHHAVLLAELQLLRLALERSTIARDAARERVLDGFTTAAAMAENLARETSIPFTRMHDVVVEMVTDLHKSGRLRPENMTGALMDRAAEKVLGHPLGLTDDDIRRRMDPAESLK